MATKLCSAVSVVLAGGAVALALFGLAETSLLLSGLAFSLATSALASVDER